LNRLLILIVVLSILLPSTSAGVSAQDETPEPGPNATRLIPSGEILGEGWDLAELRGLDVSAELFREGAVATFTGPEGSRAIIYAWLVTDSRTAIRQSWEAASGLYDNYRYRLSYSWEREERLQSIPAPEGCDEAKRADGEDEYFYAPTAITLCASDPDRIVLAIVLGGIDGVNDYTISDWLAGLVISGEDLPKPSVADASSN
jgi:hypothetical protein